MFYMYIKVTNSIGNYHNIPCLVITYPYPKHLIETILSICSHSGTLSWSLSLNDEDMPVNGFWSEIEWLGAKNSQAVW